MRKHSLSQLTNTTRRKVNTRLKRLILRLPTQRLRHNPRQPQHRNIRTSTLKHGLLNRHLHGNTINHFNLNVIRRIQKQQRHLRQQNSSSQNTLFRVQRRLLNSPRVNMSINLRHIIRLLKHSINSKLLHLLRPNIRRRRLRPTGLTSNLIHSHTHHHLITRINKRNSDLTTLNLSRPSRNLHILFILKIVNSNSIHTLTHGNSNNNTTSTTITTNSRHTLTHRPITTLMTYLTIIKLQHRLFNRPQPKLLIIKVQIRQRIQIHSHTNTIKQRGKVNLFLKRKEKPFTQKFNSRHHTPTYIPSSNPHTKKNITTPLPTCSTNATTESPISTDKYLEYTDVSHKRDYEGYPHSHSRSSEVSTTHQLPISTEYHSVEPFDYISR